MKSSSGGFPTELIIIAGVGALVYYAYQQGAFASLFASPGGVVNSIPTTNSTPGNPIGSNPSTIQMQLPPVNPPVTQTNTPPGVGTQPLSAALINLANQNGQPNNLTVDQWNYYLSVLNPSAVLTDFSEIGIQRGTSAFTMDGATYMAHRSQAGLSGLSAFRQSRIPSFFAHGRIY